MSGPIVRSGPSEKYTNKFESINWDGKAAAPKAEAAQGAKKPAKAKAAKPAKKAKKK